MQKLIFTIFTCCLISSIGVAQSNNDLKGPKAKNAKVWQKDRQSVVVYTIVDRQSVTGPKAKNKKPGIVLSQPENKVAVSRGSRRSELKGPAAKNYKPWK